MVVGPLREPTRTVTAVFAAADPAVLPASTSEPDPASEVVWVAQAASPQATPPKIPSADRRVILFMGFSPCRKYVFVYQTTK